MKYVTIKVKHSKGQDEMWCYFFDCPNCKEYGAIAEDYKFCPHCGIKIRWSKEVLEMIENYQ